MPTATEETTRRAPVTPTGLSIREHFGTRLLAGQDRERVERYADALRRSGTSAGPRIAHVTVNWFGQVTHHYNTLLGTPWPRCRGLASDN